MDYVRYYDLESYLFEDVRQQFQSEGSLSAFDFFSIVIWKANRAKSKIAKRLLREPGADLDRIVRELSSALQAAEGPRERLRILMKEWGFLLPMASAILTVLWPEVFSIYDIRACEQLDGFHKLGGWTQFDRIWPEYQRYIAAVRAKAPGGLSLRDGDRFLWGRSAALQLERDIERGFEKA